MGHNYFLEVVLALLQMVLIMQTWLESCGLDYIDEYFEG